MSNWRKYLSTLGAVAFTSLVYYIWNRAETRWLLIAAGLVYLVLVFLLYYYQRHRGVERDFGLLLFSLAAFLALLSVIEGTAVKLILFLINPCF